MALIPLPSAVHVVDTAVPPTASFNHTPGMRYAMSQLTDTDHLGTGTYVLVDLQTRTTTSISPEVLTWDHVTHGSGGCTYGSVDNDGVLWGYDSSVNGDGLGVLISCTDFGNGTITAHGPWPRNPDHIFEGMDFGTRAFTNPFVLPGGEKVVLWHNGPFLGIEDYYVYVYRNGAIQSLKPSSVTGTAFVTTLPFMQDEYGDIWVVGHAQTTGDVTSFYFWRVISAGLSPIVGDLHLVTGFPLLERRTSTTSGFTMVDMLACTVTPGEFILNLNYEVLVRVSKSTWTVTQTEPVPTNMISVKRGIAETPGDTYIAFYDQDETVTLLRADDFSTVASFEVPDDWGTTGINYRIGFWDDSTLSILGDNNGVDGFWWPLVDADFYGPVSGSITVTPAMSGAVTHPDKDGGGKVIDAREGRGDLVVLGKALVLPSSNADGSHRPLDGSLRFNDLTGWPQVFKEGEWFTLATGEGEGDGETLWIDQYKLVGRTDPGLGEPHEIAVGEGLYIFDGVLRTTTLGGSGRNVICGAISGLLNDNEIIPLGIVPFAFTASQSASYARTITPATAQTVMRIMKKTGNDDAVLMGFFTWEPGETEAVVALLETELDLLDMIFVEGSVVADPTLSDFNFLIRA